MHLLGSKAQNIISMCFSFEISLFNISAIPSGIALILQASEYVGHLTHIHFFKFDLVLATVLILPHALKSSILSAYVISGLLITPALFCVFFVSSDEKKLTAFSFVSHSKRMQM